MANPCKNFHQLQLDLNCTTAQLLKVSAHLVYWGKAKIIDHINYGNVYVVSKHAHLDVNSHHVTDFHAAFGDNYNLPDVLQTFSKPQQLANYFTEVQTVRLIRISITEWLLRRDFLCQLHYYYYFTGFTPGKDKDISRSFSKITDSETRQIDELVAGKSEKVANLFRRLYPYFNGKYHQEEILWRERVLVSDFMEMFKEFQHVLITCLHES